MRFISVRKLGLVIAVLVLCGTGVLVYMRHRHNTSADQPLTATGSSTHTITVNGQERTYRLYRPASVGVHTRAPLVVMLHGALGSGRQAENSYHWDEEADAGKFIVAYPDGYRHSWAVSSDCCGPPAHDHVNDVQFISTMVHAIAQSTGIDTRRIYATGISNGGALAYRLACDTDIFAAIGPDSATLLGDCPSPAQTSIIHIHGLADQTFPFTGGAGKRNQSAGSGSINTAGPAIPDVIASWEATNNCSYPAVTKNGLVTTSLAACQAGKAVELITIDGAGHQWPGGKPNSFAQNNILTLDPPSTALDATATIWQFFSMHPK